MSEVDIDVAKYGMGMTELTLSAWLVEVGDTVTEGQPVAEITSDKVDMEIEAPASGVLVEQSVAVDEEFEVPGSIGRIRTDADG
jgi:pyruvate dehydrogenase E2 component (dihydrolipoyllysine-residue acetyltransferase)